MYNFIGAAISTIICLSGLYLLCLALTWILSLINEPALPIYIEATFWLVIYSAGMFWLDWLGKSVDYWRKNP